MTTDNTTTENNTDVNANANTEEANKPNEQKPNDLIPLNTFLEQKKANKELKEKLATFEEKERKEAEAKLLEEKNYQELIQSKEKEATDYKSQLEQERKERKLESVKNKFTRSLDKVGAIDSEDALKLVSIDDLLDSDDIDAQIKNRVEDLTKNKSYLFGKATTRSNTENGLPAGDGSAKKPNGQKVDPALAMLLNINNK